MPKLYAISDIHVGYRENREALLGLAGEGEHREDWLILAGDLGERAAHLRWVFETLGPRFARLLWVPGNHELWSIEQGEPIDALRGQAKYEALVELCRAHGVLTPEDPYPVWEGEGGPHLLAPLFLLYDYSFRPDEVSRAGALAWARESGIECADERLLHRDPYGSFEEWCEARVRSSEARLEEARAARPLPTVLINHFPLLRAHAVLPLVPRFSIWCGTRRTEGWPARFDARVVVYGHLHIPKTRLEEGVRYEEVSFGYPRQRRFWESRYGARPVEAFLREILPGPAPGSAPGSEPGSELSSAP